MMNVTDSARKYISLGLIAAVFIGLIVASIMAKKQNEVFAMNDNVYKIMAQQAEEGDYSSVLEAADMLEESQKMSEPVSYLLAIASINEDDANQAIIHMQRALDINPHKVEDSMFMLQYAEMLSIAEKTDEALQVLEVCETLSVPESFPEYEERVIELKEQLTI